MRYLVWQYQAGFPPQPEFRYYPKFAVRQGRIDLQSNGWHIPLHMAGTAPSNTLLPKKRNTRLMLWHRWLALWPITLALILYPVSNGWLRVATLICLALLWARLLGFCWRWKALRLAVLTLTLLVIVGLNLPGRHPDKQALRERYIHALRSYEGIRYVWGGENRLGIDCSGLVRVGLINANFREGLETLNPGLMRAGLSLWWQDCSARALGEENRQFARHLFDAPAINRLGQTQLQPGDFAVTDDGAHVLAYLGGRDWIAADPDERCVLVLSVPTTNAWFDSRVKLLRWWQLDATVPK